MRKIMLLCLLLLSLPAASQENSEAISAENIQRLQSIAQIDFAGIEADFDTGNFILDATGERIAFHDAANSIYVFTSQGEMLDNFPIPQAESRNILEMVFVPNSAFPRIESDTATPEHDAIIALLEDGCLFAHGINDESSAEYCVSSEEWTHLNLWLGDSLNLTDFGNQALWSEVQLGDGSYEIQENYIFYPSLPSDRGFNYAYAPADDPEAVVRIGRIPPPYTVTSSLEGIVKVWNLQTGEILHEVDNGTGQPSVFGAINLPPTHLVWRDNANQSLYLLNFMTGENRLIDELNGDYAQWYFLSTDASVILAINLGFEPNIVAWDMATSERRVLGNYRPCNRPQPDMARLSSDGTTIVIGCDTGFDIWRIID